MQLHDRKIPESAKEEISNQPVPKVPLRAGFDFGAIKDVLQTPESNRPEISQGRVTPPLASAHALPAYSPIQRSGSAPPPVFPSPSTTPKPRPSLQLPAEDEVEPVAGPSLLTPSSARSFSMSDKPDVTSFGTNTSHSVLSPSLSFASYDGSIWPPSSDVQDNTQPLGGGYLSKSNFGPYRPTESLSFGDSSGALTSFSTVDINMPPPPVPINPFASRSALTFGGLSDEARKTDEDPWGTFTKRPVPSSNPWS